MNVAVRVGQAVMGEIRVAVDPHELCLSEVREMTRDSRLRQAKYIDEIADAELPGGEEVKNANASRIGETLENRIKVFESGRSCFH